MIPRRCYATLAGEASPTWWLTLNGEKFLRWQPHLEIELADKGDLIVAAHGMNDAVLIESFPRQQHARYQPVRHS